MTKTRVLVIEDSLTVRMRIVEVLAADPELEVVGEASDGARGVALCQALRPDVVTLDMMLPAMNGAEATERIMAYCPTPILIVSASHNRGELLCTYEAMAAGALDALDKPTGGEIDDDWERRLVATVKLLARIKVITHVRGRRTRESRPDLPVPRAHNGRPQPLRALAIGASTGGPAALVEVLGGLTDVALPIFVVLHLGKPFAPAFAEWLAGQIDLPVAYARDGEPLPEPGVGRVVLAPPDLHLVVHSDRLRLSADPPRNFCRPAVDVLFESLAHTLGPACAASLLTGMGRDGADGLLAIRRAGGRTIAQDEATSVVFGMPKEAIHLGAAEQVLPLGRISAVLGAWARPGRSS